MKTANKREEFDYSSPGVKNNQEMNNPDENNIEQSAHNDAQQIEENYDDDNWFNESSI